MVSTIRQYLIPVLVGRDAWDLQGLHRAMDGEIAPGISIGSPIAKCAIDMAVHDLLARKAGVPLCRFLGAEAGSIRLLALAQSERSPVVPNVPTTTEAGLPQLQASGWNAMFAPKGTPKEIIDKLAAAAAKAFEDPATRKRLIDIGAVIPPPERRGPEALRAFVAAEVAKWTPVIKQAGASAK